jgi:lambda family phage tail tape measure protein
VQKNLGYIETGWNAVKSAAKSAWDAALNIGREDTLDQQLKKLDEQLNAIANARKLNAQDGIGNLAPSDSFREEQLQADKTQKLILKNEQDRRAASKGFQQEQQAQAVRDQVELDKLRRETETNADKRARELGQYRELVERRVTAARASGDKSLLLSAEQQAKDIAAINEKYKDPKVARSPQYREDAGMKMLDSLRQQAAALQVQSESTEKLGTQAKALASFEQQIADIKSKDIQTADQKSILASEDLLRAQLKRNVALEQEVAARKTAAEEAGKLATFQDNQRSKLNQNQDALNAQLVGVGQGDKLRERLKEDLAIRQEYQSEVDKLNSQLNKGQISQDLFDQETATLEEALAERLVMQEDYYNQVDEMNSNFFLGMSEAWANYAEEATNFQQQAADATSSILSDVTDSVAQNIESLIKGNESIGDFFKNIAMDMANAVIGALVKMAAQWIVYQGVQLLTSRATQAAAATTMVANATATSIQASLAAFASTAAIPIVGPFAAPAAAAAAAAATAPMVAGISAAALSGMAHDGIDSIPETGTWLLQKGERVTTADTSAKLDRTLDQVQKNRTDSSKGGQTVNIIEDASRAGQTRTRLDDQGMQEVTDVFVSQIYGDGELAEAMQRRFGLRAQGE